MSDVIANSRVEHDMTLRFFCELYHNRRNSAEVVNNGMDPFEIWQNLGYRAFHEQVVPAILNRLIQNNINLGLIVFNPNTQRVNISEHGLRWAEINCNRFL